MPDTKKSMSLGEALETLLQFTDYGMGKLSLIDEARQRLDVARLAVQEFKDEGGKRGKERLGQLNEKIKTLYCEAAELRKEFEDADSLYKATREEKKLQAIEDELSITCADAKARTDKQVRELENKAHDLQRQWKIKQAEAEYYQRMWLDYHAQIKDAVGVALDEALLEGLNMEGGQNG